MMYDAVPKMSDATAELLFGAPSDDEFGSSFFHEKLLDSHFIPSLVTADGVAALLREQEDEILAFDAAVAHSAFIVRAEIASIADPTLYVLDEEVTG
jgi:hypothetical protein